MKKCIYCFLLFLAGCGGGGSSAPTQAQPSGLGSSQHSSAKCQRRGRAIVIRLLALLLCLCCACGNAPEPTAPSAGPLGESHVIPGWLSERPFVQARGDWEPFMFVVRRGHPSSFLRDLEQRRGFADPSPRDNWAAVFSQDSIDYEVRAGSNYWTTQLFKGFGLEAE